jgi:hypothetical protein
MSAGSHFLFYELLPGLQETKEYPAYSDLFGSDSMIHNYFIIRESN